VPAVVHVEKVDAELPERPSKGAWMVAWSAFAAGIGASLAANIAHAGDEIGEKFVAGWPPLALLLCSEVMMRVPAPRHPLVRAAQILGTVIVAGVAAVASYRHMKALALEYGEDSLTASTLPLSVDGLALVASIGLVVLAHQRRTAIAAERAADLAAALPPQAPVPVPPAAADPVPEPLPVPAGLPVPLPTPCQSRCRCRRGCRCRCRSRTRSRCRSRPGCRCRAWSRSCHRSRGRSSRRCRCHRPTRCRCRRTPRRTPCGLPPARRGRTRRPPESR